MQFKFLDWFKRATTAPKEESSVIRTWEDFYDLRESGRAPLSEIAKSVKKLEIIAKRKAESVLAGQYKSRFRGQGMQFADTRVYQYGDDVRHIDWRSSARSQQTYIKTFEEERELNIILLVDISASNYFGSQNYTKREAAANAIASIAFSAASNRDQISLVLFTDRIERVIPAKKSKKHVLRIIEEILAFRPEGKATNINMALKTANSLAKHSSIIVLASDFMDRIDTNLLRQTTRKHDFIAMHIIDPRELSLPNVGIVQVQDPETGEEAIIDTNSVRLRKKYAEEQSRWHSSIDQMIIRSGGDFFRIHTNSDPSQEVMQFFARRKRGK